MEEIKVEESEVKESEEKAKAKEAREKEKREIRETLEVMKDGKGVLNLENPIISGEKKITKLPYDFTSLTGLEYADAMDNDLRSVDAFKITSRQAFALFAVAAAKETEELDKRDILERMSMTDTVAAVQLATIFFLAASRAANKRITKK